MKKLVRFTLVSALFFGCSSGSGSESEATMAHSAGDEAEVPDSNGTEMDAMESDIVDTAVAAGSFTTLVTAVQAAGLENTLRSEGPFTVFAPTDEAFAALPEGTVETLLLPENRAQLVALLTYHVVSGDVRAEQAMTLTEAASVEGSAIPIEATESGLTVGGALVIQADIATSNGVIHVIDAVMLPPSMQ